VTSEVAGLRLPRNFHAYGRNNHETWKPALTLEEPDDPSRVCHYAKQLVYPPGAGIEYSPEEILARKFKQLMEQKAKPAEPAEQQQEQTLYDSYESQTSYYMTAVDGALYGQNNSSGQENTGDEDEDNEAEGEDEEEVGGANEDDDSDEEEEDEEEEEEPSEPYTNGVQFSAQTTFEQENRSIKIKFRKEPSSTYSAYTIENVYQQQQQQQQQQHTQQPPQHQIVQQPPQIVHHPPPEPAPASPIPVQRHRNGGHHHFHPYMLGQTSTPKSEANGYRKARTKVKRSKFQPDLCSNSNSALWWALIELLAGVALSVASVTIGCNMQVFRF